jgi:Arylsulfatase A and related enzymes
VGREGISHSVDCSWPAKFSGGRKIDTLIISLDILPTVLDAIHGSDFDPTPFDGKSLLLLMRSNDATHHPVLYWDSGDDKDEWAVRKGDWKLHSRKGKISLFNLVDDESETTDLSKRNAEIVQDLSALYEAWLAEMVRSEKSMKR